MTSRVLFRRASLLSLALLSFAACSDDDDDNGTGIAGTFGLGAPSGAVTVAAGGTGTVTIPLTRSGGLTAPILLAARDLPDGVSVSFNPGAVQPGIDAATMIVRVSEAVPATTGTFRVVARVEGRTDSASTTVNLTTTAMPRFTAAFPTDTAQVQRGQSVVRNVTVNRIDGYAGEVQLVLDGPPVGVTWTSTPTTGNTASITINTTAAAQATTRLLSARVIAVGRPDATGLVRISINAEPGVQVAVPAATVFQGNTGSVAVTVNREGGFTGGVTVTLSNLPAGVTAAPVNSASGSTVTVPLTIAENAAVGTSNITAAVSGTGIETKMATGALTVNNTLLSPTPLPIADSRARFNFRVYRVVVPAGATKLTVTMAGGTGDADIYLIPPGEIDSQRAVCAPFAGGNNEVCEIDNPEAGTWYAYIEVWDPYAGATLAATVTGGSAIRSAMGAPAAALPIAELQQQRAVNKRD